MSHRFRPQGAAVCLPSRSRVIRTLLASALALAGSSSTVQAEGAPQVPAWVTARPARATQVEKTTAERGMNPCNVTDPGFGGYQRWIGAGGSAYVLVPKKLQANKSGSYNVVVHFHGREAARKQWVNGGGEAVVVGVDLGLGSGAYLKRYADPSEMPRLLARVRKIVAEATGRPNVKQGKVAIASWSAGYGATLRILSRDWGKKTVDAVILLDGLHTSIQGTRLTTRKLEPFVEFAKRAARGEKMMFVSHSSILPPGYASTTTTSNYLVWRVGGKPVSPAPVKRKMPMGLEQVSFFQKGSFTVRGFSGNGKKDHCAHFGLLSSHVGPALQRRWARSRR